MGRSFAAQINAATLEVGFRSNRRTAGDLILEFAP
jgi:hypothetical protein